MISRNNIIFKSTGISFLRNMDIKACPSPANESKVAADDLQVNDRRLVLAIRICECIYFILHRSDTICSFTHTRYIHGGHTIDNIHVFTNAYKPKQNVNRQNESEQVTSCFSEPHTGMTSLFSCPPN